MKLYWESNRRWVTARFPKPQPKELTKLKISERDFKTLALISMISRLILLRVLIFRLRVKLRLRS